HIGNTGANAEDAESARIYAAGLVIREEPLLSSSWRQNWTLSDYLKQQGIPGIAGIDTRKLTRMLRDRGAQDGCLVAGKVDEAEALAAARAFPGMVGLDLAKEVSCDSPYRWTEGVWALGKGHTAQTEARLNVVAYDFGVKRNILRKLASQGCSVTVVP